MKKRNRSTYAAARKTSLLLILLLILTSVTALPVRAEKTERKVVRVGWYKSPFNTMDRFGRRSGYAYEYQRKIAAYTGWDYEYVEGSWSDLLQMLSEGKIDLMSDVSFTEERAEKMYFTDLPMGTEEYYLFVSRDNREIRADNYFALNGKKIGVTKGSIQIKLLKDWIKLHGLNSQVVEVTESGDEIMQLLNSGAIDAYLGIDTYDDLNKNIPICRMGSSDFYFAVSKERRDLLRELNAAMTRLHDENRFFNEDMYEKYYHNSSSIVNVPESEKAWLENHGAIRVGYQDNYMAFCARDKDGKLTGALKDYLEFASTSLDTNIEFEPVSYPTVSEAIEAMKEGEIDCVFPANFTANDAETLDLIMSPPLMRSEMYAVVRKSEQKSFVYQEKKTVAVNEGNPNYDYFLIDNFPGWETKHYKDTSKCLEAVSNEEADCVIISNYRFNNISKQCEKLHLTTVSTGVSMDYSFAVCSGQTELFSILSRITTHIPSSVANAALTYYSTENVKTGITDFLKEHMAVIFAIAAAIALIIMALFLRSVKAQQKAKKGQQLITATETDALTGLYARNYFFAYVKRFYREHSDRPMDAILINIERFHNVNAMKGRDFGDLVLRTIGDEIRAYIGETDGIPARIGGDRFALYCEHTDNYQELLDRLNNRMDELGQDANIRLRMGVMPWQKDVAPQQQFDRAHMACNMARGNYSGGIIVFDDKMRDRELRDRRLLSDVRRAIDDREFEVYYQPKYDIQTEAPELRSAEALVRWKHHELGMISPMDFIPLFEKNGMIETLDKYVWTEAARQIAEWRDKYGVVLPVSVNLSRVDIFDPKLESTLDSLLEQNKLEHSSLKLEVTESAYTDNADHVIEVIEGLRKKGYEIEMDDFGSGYSSLNMLSSMPIDVLKMDKAFIQNIEHEEKDIQLVKLILDIAKNLNVPVVAEGVETKSQLELLRKLGCRLVQGYYFSRPLPAADFERDILCADKK